MRYHLTAAAFILMFVPILAQKQISGQTGIPVEPLRNLSDSKICSYNPVENEGKDTQIRRYTEKDAENDTLIRIEMGVERSFFKKFIPMICHPSYSKDSLKYLFGLLHLKFQPDTLKSISTITIATDGKQPIAGEFLLDMNKKPANLSATDSIYTIEIDSITYSSGNETYIAVPENNYEKITVRLYDANDKPKTEQEFCNVTVKRGFVTELNTTGSHKGSRKDPPTPCHAKRPKITGFQLDLVSKVLNSSLDLQITYDPHASASIECDGDIGQVEKVGIFQTHYSPYGKETYIKSPEDDVYDIFGNVNPVFDSIGLWPGLNTFYANIIVHDKCGRWYDLYTSAFRQEKSLLVLKTETCPFDYKYFTKRDSLCLYVEKWDMKKWGTPGCGIEWEWSHKEGGGIKSEKGTVDCNVTTDGNHFKGALNLFKNYPVAVKKGNYQIVVHGNLRYRAATYYYVSNRYTYKEEGKWMSFSTDLIKMGDITPQKDGSISLTGYLNPELKANGNILKSEYFDGSERGFIIIPKKEYHGTDNLPENIHRYKKECPDQEGEQFRYIYKGADPKQEYYYWAYMKVGEFLFVSNMVVLNAFSDTGIFKDVTDTGIFEDVPDSYRMVLGKLTEMSEAYGNETDKSKKRVILEEAKRYCAENYHATSKIRNTMTTTRQVKFQTEGNLPYEVLSVKRVSIVPMPQSYEYGYINEFNKFSPVMSITASKHYVTDPEILFQQFPLFLVARLEIEIRVPDLNAASEDGVILVNCYVPGTNGPDGRQLGYIDSEWGLGGTTYVVEENKDHDGDRFTVYADVCGWGTPDMFRSMRSITFTDKPDKLNVTNSILQKGIQHKHSIDIGEEIKREIRKYDDWFIMKRTGYLKSLQK